MKHNFSILISFFALVFIGSASVSPVFATNPHSPRPSSSPFVMPTMPPMPTPLVIDTRKYDVVIVRGTITDSSNNAVKDAQVTIECNGVTYTKKSNAIGFYLVTFKPGECHNGDMVTVNGVKDDTSGSNSDAVSGLQSIINVQLTNVSVPEFGEVAGMMAVAGSLGAFYFFRKRFAF